MTTTKVFAAQYERTEEELIKFPDDVQERRRLMPHKVDHPAHNNIFMYREIVEYLSSPGDVVCDPMAGAGTILISCPQDRKLRLIELGPYFVAQLMENSKTLGWLDRDIYIKEGDCTVELPRIKEDIQLILFSPPYANQIQMSKGHAIYDDREQQESTTGVANFAYDDKRNLGNMKEFYFNRAMKKVYQACFEATKPNGYLCIIIKDRMDKGKKIPYGFAHFRMMKQAGYELFEWYQRVAIGMMFGHFNKARGIKQVEDEHIIMMRKPC